MSSALEGRVRALAGSPLVRASAALMAAQVVSGVIGIAFWGLLSRSCPASDVGQATTLIAVSAALTLLMTAGLAPAILLAVPRASGPGEAAATTWIAVAVAGLLGLGAGLGAAYLLPLLATNLDFLRVGAFPWVLAAVTAATAAGSVVDPAAAAVRRTWLVALRALLFSGAKIILLALLLRAGFAPAAAVGISWSACAIVTSVLILAWVHRWQVPQHWARAGAALRHGIAHHHAAALGGGLPPLLIPLMVTAVLGTAVSAQFSITWMLAAVFFMVSPAVATISLAHAAADGSDLARQLRHAAWLIAAIVAVPIVVAVIFGAQILAVFGPDYPAAAPLLALLALSVIPDAVTNLAVSAARVHGRLRLATTLNTVIALVVLASVWALLPTFGLLAPGIGWCLGQGVGTILVAAYAFRARRNRVR